MEQLPAEIEPLLSKREITLNKSGATKKVAYEKIVEKLSATSMTLDKFGEEHISDDNVAQLKATELILKLHNDIKPDGAVTNVTNNVIVVSSDEMKGYIEESRKLRRINANEQTGEIIDVQKYSGN